MSDVSSSSKLLEQVPSQSILLESIAPSNNVDSLKETIIVSTDEGLLERYANIAMDTVYCSALKNFYIDVSDKMKGNVSNNNNDNNNYKSSVVGK